MEMVICLQDLLMKWMSGCETVEEMSEVIIEQLLNTMPSDLRISVRERNPQDRN